MDIKNLNTAQSLTHAQYVNLLAIDLLEKTGNNMPTQAEIDATELLFAQLRQRYKNMPFAIAVEKIYKEVTNDLLGSCSQRSA